MADSSPLAGLLDRAGNVFSLAGKLGRTFHEGHQGQRQQIDPAGRKRHAPAFDEFCAALLDLRDAMQNPPDGFAPVAEPLLQAARIAKGIRDAMQRPDLRTWASYLEFFPHLNSVCEAGWRAVKEVTKARRLDDPFAFVDEPAATPAYSLLDRFPATPAADAPMDLTPTNAKTKRSTERGEGRIDDQAAVRLLNIFTNGLADERLDKAGVVLNDNRLTVDEKLWKIDALMPIPPTVSAANLGKALGVSKTAIQNTKWYLQKRKGQKDNEIGQRHEQHRQRGQQYESDRERDDDD